MCCEDTLLRELHVRGLRLTPQREIVLRVLHGLPNDAPIGEIQSAVNRLCPTIDLSTVYRTLDLFAELHLVACFSSMGERHYELLTMHQPHLHLLCRRCGGFTAVPLSELGLFAGQLQREHGFSLSIEHLVMPGYCADCQAVPVNAAPGFQRQSRV